MAYGFINTPAVFQAFMNDLFRHMLNRFVIVYLEDILIYSRTYSDHMEHVRRVLRLLHEHRLCAKEV